MTNRSKIFFSISTLILIVFILPLSAQGEREMAGNAAVTSGGMENNQNQMLKIRGPLPGIDGYKAEAVETAVFAGGCFWGVEAVFEQLQGVLDVESGYSGGEADTAQYYVVGSGTTGHAEAVQIIYDPKQIDYKTLLEVFFTVAHNPTELNFQGPDHGTQYRSAVFYLNQSQKTMTEEFIDKLEMEGTYSDKIVTEVSPLKAFYKAEDYHQDFLRLNPDYPYIVYWDLPKLRDLQMMYPELLAAGE